MAVRPGRVPGVAHRRRREAEAAVAKIKNVIWRNGWAYGRATYKGKEHVRALGTTSARVAEERVRKWLDEKRAARWGERPQRSFQDAVRHFTETHFSRVKPSTKTRYLHSLLNLTQHLSTKALDEIGMAELSSYEAAQRKIGKAAPTIRRDLAALSILFEVAIEAEWIDQNPVKAFLRRARRRGLVENPPRNRVLDHDEEERLVHAALAMSKGSAWTRDMLAAFIVLSIDLGLRSDELLGLTWRHVDLERNEVTIVSSRAKSKRERRVPILPRSQKVLKALPRHSSSLYVIHGRVGQRYHELWHRMQDAAAFAGIEDITVHDLRRTCGVRLLRDHKLSMEQVSKWLGHSSVKVTERVYAFLTVDDLHKAVGTAVQKTELAIEHSPQIE